MSETNGIFDLDYIDYLARTTYNAVLDSYEANREAFEEYMQNLAKEEESAVNGQNRKEE